MSTTTQYNPNVDLNAKLFAAGASKTVYALVTPEVENVRREMLVSDGELRLDYIEQFRDAWTAKQDAMHEEFFSVWHAWSKPVVDLDRTNFPFYYPTAGASEPLRQLIYDFAVRSKGRGHVHVFAGEYEGYRAIAEAARLKVIEHTREEWSTVSQTMRLGDLFFISAPSAIDGNIWKDFNDFLSRMPKNSVVADVTYVGAVANVPERFDLNQASVRDVVFSLSKPFGVYYDRIGGVFCREENPALFGNKWFKNLTSLRLGTALMNAHGVFDLPRRYRGIQLDAIAAINETLCIRFEAADVYILGVADRHIGDIADYLLRGPRHRICLTKLMAETVGTSGVVS